MKQIAGLFVLLIVLIIFNQKFYPLPRGNNNFLVPPTKVTNSQAMTGKVSQVFDGDTIMLTDGQKVRYIGIDTPEYSDPNNTTECFGKEASDENKKLVEGKTVKLVKDTSDKDSYGRLLRFVYLPGGGPNGQDLFVNDYLVRNGFATAATYPPDTKYSSQFLTAEKDAKTERLGLWSRCP